MVGKLDDLKARLGWDGGLNRAKGLPNLDTLQQNLSDRGSLCAPHFPLCGRAWGKLCIRRNGAAVSTFRYNHASTSEHIDFCSSQRPRIIRGRNLISSSGSSALLLREHLFGGLEALRHSWPACDRLLARASSQVCRWSAPDRSTSARWRGYDLATAKWLISIELLGGAAGAILATLPLERRPIATRSFLGIAILSTGSTRVASPPESAIYFAEPDNAKRRRRLR